MLRSSPYHLSICVLLNKLFDLFYANIPLEMMLFTLSHSVSVFLLVYPHDVQGSHRTHVCRCPRPSFLTHLCICRLKQVTDDKQDRHCSRNHFPLLLSTILMCEKLLGHKIPCQPNLFPRTHTSCRLAARVLLFRYALSSLVAQNPCAL